MTMSQETLTVANAPRDAAQLAGKGAYKLRKLATDLQLLNDPAHKSAFINGKPDEMAQVVAAGLRAYDAQNGSNGAANGTVATPPASVMAPTLPISIPGPVSVAPAMQPAPAAEQPAPTGRTKRTPQPADAGELGAILKELKEAVATNAQAVSTLAKPVLEGKGAAETAANNSAAVYQLIVQGQKQQALILSLLLMIGEHVLQDGQGALVGAATENMGFMPQVFGAPAGKAG